jgi:hypothetical protein
MEQTNQIIQTRHIIRRLNILLTCWYAWKQNAAINDLVYICLRFKPCTKIRHNNKDLSSSYSVRCHVQINSRVLTADCKNAGLTLMPSVNKATGAKRKNDMTVMIEKRLMLSRDS